MHAKLHIKLHVNTVIYFIQLGYEAYFKIYFYV